MINSKIQIYKYFSKKNIFYFIFIFFILFQFNFFLNFYTILKKNYSDRMQFYGGYCSNQGYGFIKKIYKEKKITDNIIVKNFNDRPSIEGYFYNVKNSNSKNYIILIGAQEKELKIYLDNKYYPIEQYNDCYLLKKND